jgi:DNA-directed RNA polymerase subunit RPC12/RpoP
MASWDSAADADAKKVGLRCLACGRRLDESLAVVGSLRCLDCRESNATLKGRLMTPAGRSEHGEGRNHFLPSPPS